MVAGYGPEEVELLIVIWALLVYGLAFGLTFLMLGLALLMLVPSTQTSDWKFRLLGWLLVGIGVTLFIVREALLQFVRWTS